MRLKFIRAIFLPNFRETLFRFPLPIVCAFLFTVFSIAEIHNITHPVEPKFGRYLTALFCCCFASISIKLFAESNNWDFRKYLIISVAVFAGIFLLMLLSTGYLIHFFFLATGLVLSMSFAGYLFKKQKDENACCYFNSTILSSMFFAAAAAAILGLGITITISSIQYLFEVKFSSEIFVDIWIVSCALFAPFYALSSFPVDLNTKQKLDYQKSVKFIVLYILSPLVLIYFLILYAYILKIILQMELPKGNLAYMITSFGTIGIITHFLAYPLKDSGNKLIKFICSYFYHLLVPAVILLFVAIGVRLFEYGVTEQRYAVAIVAVWLGAASLYVIFSGGIKAEGSKLKIVPTILSVMLILASVGPWGAVSVSGYSQVNRLRVLLEKNNILVDGRIIPTKREIDFKEEQSISSIILYLTTTDKTDLIKNWFPSQAAINKENKFYELPTKIVADMGLRYFGAWHQKDNFFYRVPYNARKGYKTTDFDYLIELENLRSHMHNNIKDPGTEIIVSDETGKAVIFNAVLADNILSISDGKGHRVDFNLEDGVRKFHEAKLPQELSQDTEKFTMKSIGNGLSAKAYFKDISGKIDGRIHNISNVSLALLIKYLP